MIFEVISYKLMKICEVFSERKKLSLLFWMSAAVQTSRLLHIAFILGPKLFCYLKSFTKTGFLKMFGKISTVVKNSLMVGNFLGKKIEAALV